MYCKFCGNQIPDGALFCSACGKKQDVANTQSQETAFTAEQPVPEVNCVNVAYEERKSEQGGKILTFAILGMAFGISWVFSLLGLIFSIVSRAKLNSYRAKYGETEGRATVGKHLGLAALIVNIVMVSIFVLYIALIVLAILASV